MSVADDGGEPADPAPDESDGEASAEGAPGPDVTAPPVRPPLPDGLIAPLLEAAGEALRRLAAPDVPPAARRLRAFDRRGLATPAARHQLRKLLEEDEDLVAAAAGILLDRPDAARLAAAWQEATSAGGDAPLALVSATADEGRLPLLASVLAGGLPAGFEFGLGLVVALADVVGRASDAAGAVRRATAARAAAEEGLRRAEAARDTARAEVDRLDTALKEERRVRRALEQQAADTAAGADTRHASLEAALAAARQAAAAADERAAAAEQRAAGADERATTAEERATVAAERLAAAESRAEAAESRAAEAESRAAAGRLAVPAGPESRSGARGVAVPTGTGAGGLLDDQERMALGEVARAAGELAAWLQRLADGPPSVSDPHLTSPPRTPPPAAPPPPSQLPVTRRPAPPSPASPGRWPGSPFPPGARQGGGGRSGRRSGGTGAGGQAQWAGRRAPVQLPPGMLEEDPAAVEAMVRTPGVAVIVDGYNVSMLAWPGVSAAEQRERLCDALTEFQLRFRCEVTVVFDGAEVPGVRPLRRRGLRVVFSAADQEADEVVVGEVMFRPDDVPVIVVSSDREVGARAMAEGATVLPADRFLHLLRR